MSALQTTYVITGIGAITCVGGNALQTSAAVNAKIIGITEHPIYQCKPRYPDEEKPLPLYCARVPFIKESQTGAERLLQIASPALKESIAHAQLDISLISTRVALLVALPALDTVTSTWNLTQGFIPALSQRAEIYPVAHTEIATGERTCVFELLVKAQQLMEQDLVDVCIVGGVDSYLFKHRLDELDRIELLRSKKNIDGFIPGEAAAFFIVEKKDFAQQRGIEALANIHRLGKNSEPNTPPTGRKSSGIGLTKAVQESAAGLGLPFKTIFSDLNGESYRAFEWGILQVRLATLLHPKFNLMHPAECYGDVGAASGALLITLATQALRPNEFRAPRHEPVLLFTAAYYGDRMAISLTPMQ